MEEASELQPDLDRQDRVKGLDRKKEYYLEYPLSRQLQKEKEQDNG